MCCHRLHLFDLVGILTLVNVAISLSGLHSCVEIVISGN